MSKSREKDVEGFYQSCPIDGCDWDSQTKGQGKMLAWHIRGEHGSESHGQGVKEETPEYSNNDGLGPTEKRILREWPSEPPHGGHRPFGDYGSNARAEFPDDGDGERGDDE